MVTYYRIFRNTGTFLVPPDFDNAKFHLWGGGQAGFDGTYGNAVASPGGIGGKGSDYAQYAPATTLQIGTVCNFVRGAGGLLNGAAGADSTLTINAIIRALAAGGNSGSVSVGTLTFAGGIGGDPSICALPPPGPFVPGAYGGGGGGAAGPNGRGGNGANQSQYAAPTSQATGNWRIGIGPLAGLYCQVNPIANGGGILAYSGGGSSDGGAGQLPLAPWLDALDFTNIPAFQWVGNGGGRADDPTFFFTVAGNQGGLNSGACAPQSTGTCAERISPFFPGPVLNAHGGDGIQFTDTTNLSRGGPGTGAASFGSVLFTAPYGGLLVDFCFGGFPGGLFGGAGSGGSSIWDFGGNGFQALFDLSGGSGADGGMIVEWTPNPSMVTHVAPQYWKLPPPFYVMEPARGKRR